LNHSSFWGETGRVGVRFIAFILLFVHFQAVLAGEQQPRVVNGTIHIKASDLRAGPVSLEGDWNFSFLDHRGLIKVPASWTWEGYPKFGVGIYELNIEFDEVVETLALGTDYFSTEANVYANGRLIHGPAQFTEVADRVPVTHASFRERPVHGTSLHLTIGVSNRIDQIAGIMRPIFIGMPNMILDELHHKKLLLIPVMSIFSVIVFYFLLIVSRKDYRTPALMLACCGLCTILFFAVQFAFFSGHVQTWKSLIHSFDIGWMGAVYFFSLYNSNIFRSQFPLWYTRFFQQIPLVIFLLTLVLPIEWRAPLTNVLNVQILGTVLVNGVVMVGAARRKVEGTLAFLMPSVLLIGAAAHDILFAMGYINSIYLFGYVFIVYFMTQAYLLTHRHSTILMELTRSNLLKSQLILSQKISGISEQIELDHPQVKVSNVFLPSEDASGDWVYFRQQDGYLYFFLADVTDHGFDSALMTVVISSAVIAVLDEHKGSDASPTALLERCATVANQAVCRVGPSLRKLSTLSLHCLDLDRGILFYIQAGHMPTLLQGATRFKALINSHGLLGQDASYTFHAKEFQLKPGEKLFAYTDGLTENVKDPVRGPLKQRKLIKILAAANNPQEIKEILMPYLAGPNTKDMDDAAFIALQWVLQDDTPVLAQSS
jgi:hypothetical protein